MRIFQRKLLLIVVFITLISGLTYIAWLQVYLTKLNTTLLSPNRSNSINTESSNNSSVTEYDKIVDLIAGNFFIQDMPTNLKDKDWVGFTDNVKKNWLDYYSEIGRPMMEWSASEIQTETKKVFYPFSGPDFITLYQLYPHASHYVMIAQQKGEHLVNLSLMKPLDVAPTLQVLSSAWSSFGRNGFFVTEYLFKYISLNKVKIGSTTLIASFAHLQGFSIKKISPIEINERGLVRELDDDQPWDSIRFYLSKDGKLVTVDYLSIDLSNEGMKKKPQNLIFFEESSKSPILLKAASHLPQHKNFTLIRDAILNNSPFIIQDETGLDYKPLSKVFNTVLYGHFEKPYKMFLSYNKDLAKAYQNRQDIKPIPFRIGYFKDGNYSLIVANRKTY